MVEEIENFKIDIFFYENDYHSFMRLASKTIFIYYTFEK